MLQFVQELGEASVVYPQRAMAIYFELVQEGVNLDHYCRVGARGRVEYGHSAGQELQHQTLPYNTHQISTYMYYHYTHYRTRYNI